MSIKNNDDAFDKLTFFQMVHVMGGIGGDGPGGGGLPDDEEPEPIPPPSI